MCNIVDSYLRSSGSSNSVCKVTLQLPNIQHNEANIKNNLIQEFVCLFVWSGEEDTASFSVRILILSFCKILQKLVN